MKIIEIALKIFSISFFDKGIGAVINIIGSFSQLNRMGASIVMVNMIYLISYMIIFIILFDQPKWFRKLILRNEDKDNLELINIEHLVEGAVAILSLYFILVGLIKVVTFIAKYAILKNIESSPFAGRTTIQGDLINQIEPILGIIIGVIIITSKDRVVAFLKRRKNSV